MPSCLARSLWQGKKCPLVSYLESLKNCSVYSERWWKDIKSNLNPYSWFLMSFKPEDTKLTTGSFLKYLNLNKMFSTTLAYSCIHTQYSFRLQVAYVFITISTSKPILLEPSFCFSCLGSYRWTITTFVVIVKDHLIFRGHMPYVLKEDDKYCFVTFSWQNAKWSENKDTFHTWSFKKILGKNIANQVTMWHFRILLVRKEVHSYSSTTLR